MEPLIRGGPKTSISEIARLEISGVSRLGALSSRSQIFQGLEPLSLRSQRFPRFEPLSFKITTQMSSNRDRRRALEKPRAKYNLWDNLMKLETGRHKLKLVIRDTCRITFLERTVREPRTLLHFALLHFAQCIYARVHTSIYIYIYVYIYIYIYE